MVFRSTLSSFILAAFTVVAFSGYFHFVGAQNQQNNNDPTTLLQSAKSHLAEAANDLKTGGSDAALTQINMTHQDITSAERVLNSTLICNNTDNLGFCATS